MVGFEFDQYQIEINYMMLGSKGTNPIVLAQIGFGTCDPPEHEEVAICVAN